MDKRAVSPLIATIFLVTIVVLIGASVMLVIKSLSEENVTINVTNHVCELGVNLKIINSCLEDGHANIVLENDGHVNIINLKLVVSGEYNNFESKDTIGSLEVGSIKRFDLLFPGMTELGNYTKARIIPIVQQNKESFECPKSGISFEKSECAKGPS